MPRQTDAAPTHGRRAWVGGGTRGMVALRGVHGAQVCVAPMEAIHPRRFLPGPPHILVVNGKRAPCTHLCQKGPACQFGGEGGGNDRHGRTRAVAAA